MKRNVIPPDRIRRNDDSQPVVALESASEDYQYKETRDLVDLVKSAADMLHRKGEPAFTDFRLSGSRWQQDETYIFILDTQGNMLVHPDPAMEGRNVLDLKDVTGRPIIRGLIEAATSLSSKPEGWYHYQWPVPGGIFPRWKSSYVQFVTTPSGAKYVVGSGMYNDRMERSFIVDLVKDAVGQIEKNGSAAFRIFRDPSGPFIAKDAYVFVYDMNGVNLVLPAFPNLEGRDMLAFKDTRSKQPICEMLDIAQTRGGGWVDYMWPKPGENVPTQKSSYVSKAKMGDRWVVVGSGIYLADAPRDLPTGEKLAAPELMALVREAAAVFEKQGEQAYPEFRRRGSKWFHDDTYFFVLTLDGTKAFHAAEPAGEGGSDIDLKDVLGKPFIRMFLDTAGSPSGEGWVHYMYPEPGNLFPTWKSTFLKRVTFPSGKPHVIGCGIYNMQMDRAFIEDVVNRAARLVAERGNNAFGELRDKTGPFVFMDTYVFVLDTAGTELVNPPFPTLEGKNIINLRDLKGKAVAREEIDMAMKRGSAWVDCYWYKPGQNAPARKQAFVCKVRSGSDIYIVGSGVYLE